MITLRNGSLQSSVNLEGAWVETLSSNGEAILFPKSELKNETGDLKARGGMHVCLPNFGPGGESGLPQHGFGRTSLWSVIQQEDSSVILGLEVTSGDYAGLSATLQYRLGGSSLETTLKLTNRGSTPLRVAPGFHPYFALGPSETTIGVNGESFNLSELAGTEYRQADSAEVVLAERHVHMKTENLTTWAIWTDQLGDYVCVEPTFGGNRFLEEERADERLIPYNTKQFSVTVHW